MSTGVEAARQREEGVFAPQRRALTVGILIAVFAFAAEGMAVVPALPTAVRALSGLPLFGWVFSSFLLAWLVGTTAGGQLADTHGPRRPVAIGLAAFAGGLLLAASATGMAQFLAGRVLQGLGGGGMIAATYVGISRGYPDALRARMLALCSSAWILPAVVGPAISGAVAQRMSWRLVFAAIVPLLAIAALLLLPALRPFTVQQPAPPSARIPTSLQLALGAGLLLGVPNFYAAGVGLVGAGLLGGLGLGLLVPAVRRLLPLGTFSSQRGLPAGIAARGLLALSFFTAEAFLPLTAGELRGVSPTQAGLALTTSALGWIAASWIQDRLDARGGPNGRIRLVRLGFLLVTLSIASAAAVLVTSLPFLLLPLAWAIGGAGIGLAYTAIGLLCLALAPAGHEGEVSGQLQMSESLGTALGAGIGGALLAGFGRLDLGTRAATTTLFGITLAAAVLGVALAGRISPASTSVSPEPGPAPDP